MDENNAKKKKDASVPAPEPEEMKDTVPAKEPAVSEQDAGKSEPAADAPAPEEADKEDVPSDEADEGEDEDACDDIGGVEINMNYYDCDGGSRFVGLMAVAGVCCILGAIGYLCYKHCRHR